MSAAWAIAGADRLAPRLARTIVGVILTAICLVSVEFTATERHGPIIALGIALELTLLAMQLFFFNVRVLEFPSRAGYAALAVQVVLVYAPLPVFGQGWVAAGGFLAGSVLLALPSPVSWAAFAVVIVLSGAGQAAVKSGADNISYSVVSTLITGLVVYTLCRLGSLVLQLQSARHEIGRMAASAERLRIARDLHDLLGYSLSAITLKTELTRHVVVTKPEQAQETLDEILGLSRQALSDVRAVARGYRNMSVHTESNSVRSVLVAANIEPHIDVELIELPERLDTVLATVLREGITNVLRHSTARSCSVTLARTDRGVVLRLVNDGAVLDGPVTKRSGSGLDSLAIRVGEVGGSLTAEPVAPASFVITAEVPLPGRSVPFPA